MGLKNSKKPITLLLLVTFGLWMVCAGSAFGSVTFTLFDEGSNKSSLTVTPGGGFSMDIVAENIAADGFASAELDAFTYRIVFPNEDFTLTGNIFADPFDNIQSPGGFNGSIPWHTGTDIPITNGVDAGSPGATALEADLYRTTATKTGSPVTGNLVVLETLKLIAPDLLGDYAIEIDLLEAVDAMGEFHTLKGGTSFTVSVVPIPAAAWLLVSGLACIIGLRRRMNMKKPNS